MCPIKSRKQHPVYGWTYVIHEHVKGSGLVIWANVSQEDVVKEMDLWAKFKVGDPVQIGTFNVRTVIGRKWDFQTGTMKYVIEGSRSGRDWTMDQDELERRIKAATEEHA